MELIACKFGLLSLHRYIRISLIPFFSPLFPLGLEIPRLISRPAPSNSTSLFCWTPRVRIVCEFGSAGYTYFFLPHSPHAFTCILAKPFLSYSTNHIQWPTLHFHSPPLPVGAKTILPVCLHLATLKKHRRINQTKTHHNTQTTTTRTS